MSSLKAELALIDASAAKSEEEASPPSFLRFFCCVCPSSCCTRPLTSPSSRLRRFASCHPLLQKRKLREAGEARVRKVEAALSALQRQQREAESAALDRLRAKSEASLADGLFVGIQGYGGLYAGPRFPPLHLSACCFCSSRVSSGAHRVARRRARHHAVPVG